MKITLGLCKGRHDIKEVSDYIFDTEVNPLDLDGMSLTVYNKLTVNRRLICKELDLYVTGLSVALVSVINFCCLNHIALTLYHFDRDSNTYYPQAVLTRVDYDLLVEGGYYAQG